RPGQASDFWGWTGLEIVGQTDHEQSLSPAPPLPNPVAPRARHESVAPKETFAARNVVPRYAAEREQEAAIERSRRMPSIAPLDADFGQAAANSVESCDVPAGSKHQIGPVRANSDLELFLSLDLRAPGGGHFLNKSPIPFRPFWIPCWTFWGLMRSCAPLPRLPTSASAALSTAVTSGLPMVNTSSLAVTPPSATPMLVRWIGGKGAVAEWPPRTGRFRLKLILPPLITKSFTMNFFCFLGVAGSAGALAGLGGG